VNARRLAVRAPVLVVGAALLWLGWSAAADTATVRGTAAGNILEGTKGADTIYGGAGPDKLYGLQGNDTLYGGRGNDTIYGGPGNDRIFGGPGNDTIYGGPGKDTISCGTGHDVVHADAVDRVSSDCEVVIRPKPSAPNPPATTPAPPPSPPPAPSPTTTVAPPTTTTQAPPPTTTAPPPTPTCGQGPASYRYSVIKELLSTPSVSVTVTINQLPSSPADGDHGLAYVAVAYGVSADGCSAAGWLQGGIWRGATRFDSDTGSAFLYAEWQTSGGYQLIRLANVAVPSTHTFTLEQGVGNTWAIWIDGKFIASVVLDQAPTAFSTAAEDYSVDGVSWPSFDWTFSAASPSFTHPPSGLLPHDSFSSSGWHTSQ
jgi:RTX calcium-binding nonapeptide repeat (4 copies)